MDKGYRTVRIKFSKGGLMKYIGHLDLMRCFQRVLRRTGLDIAYTEGFSPHQIMTFAQPLGVGIYSKGEYMDLTFRSLRLLPATGEGTKVKASHLRPSLLPPATGEEALKETAQDGADSSPYRGSIADSGKELTGEEIKNIINREQAEGIRVEAVVLLPEKAGNAMASIASASYTVQFRSGKAPSIDICGAVSAFHESEEVLIAKKTKKSEREIDLKKLVYELKYLKQREPAELDSYGERLYMRLCAESGDNVKPQLLLGSLYELKGVTAPPDTEFIITREDLFDHGGKSLIEAGDIF